MRFSACVPHSFIGGTSDLSELTAPLPACCAQDKVLPLNFPWES